jgi:hypothetical protein
MPQTLKVKLDLRADADFRLVVPTRRKQVIAGTDAVYNVRSDNLTGWVDGVDLDVTGLPTGASATIGSDPIGYNGQTDITVETTGTSAGTYEFLIGGDIYTPPPDLAGYWVSPTGAATWSASYNTTALSGAACCSITTANANAVAGDKVYLREGTYNISLHPSHSGTLADRITWTAYGSEVPTFTVTDDWRYAIWTQGTSYSRFIGIRSYQSYCFFSLYYGSCYNEFRDCIFEESGGFDYSQGRITGYNTGFSAMLPSSHNWFYNCTFSKYGAMENNGGAVNDLGSIANNSGYADTSGNNTFENCDFSHGGHDCLAIMGRYNVIKTNRFHNDESYFVDEWGSGENSPASGYFGNRCLLFENANTDRYNVAGQEAEPRVTTNYPGSARDNLVEGNRLGHSGCPPDDDGANLIENAGIHTIIRFNDMFAAGANAYYSKAQPYPGASPATPSTLLKSGSYARVYNNSIYKSGIGDPDIGSGYKNGMMISSYWVDSFWPWPVDQIAKNNINYDWVNSELDTYDEPRAEFLYENNYNQNPLFVNTDISDKHSLTLPDLNLQAGSACIGGGVHLTLASGSGNSSSTLVVDDAQYFQDGAWGSDLARGVTFFPDWIAIGTVGNVVEISSINYDTNTIALASPMTWANDAPVWLYKNSSGVRALYGSAPEQGAHPYPR